MIEAWPVRLPSPMVQGYSEAFGDPRRWGQGEQGIPRVRRRSSSVARSVSMAMQVDDAQRALFDRFWLELTREGAVPFVMPDEGRDNLPLLDENDEVLTDENDRPLTQTENRLCMFGQGAPQHRPVSKGIWEISFPVVVYP